MAIKNKMLNSVATGKIDISTIKDFGLDCLMKLSLDKEEYEISSILKEEIDKRK